MQLFVGQGNELCLTISHSLKLPYTYTFFLTRNLVSKAPGLNLGKNLSNFLNNREVLNK